MRHNEPSCAVPETLNWKNVVLVLARRLPQDKSQRSESAGTVACPTPLRCVSSSVLCLNLFSLRLDEESVLMVWNSTMPMEVKDLRRHCEKREQIAAKMREQLHQD